MATNIGSMVDESSMYGSGIFELLLRFFLGAGGASTSSLRGTGFSSLSSSSSSPPMTAILGTSSTTKYLNVITQSTLISYTGVNVGFNHLHVSSITIIELLTF